MASCAGCKRRTTSFCFVHKISVCDDCTANKSAGHAVAPAITCEPNDVIGNYFDWLADADFSWPPRCNLCNRTVTADRDSVIRLVCKDVFHRSCLHEHLSRALSGGVPAAKLQCPSCNLLCVDPATQPRTKLREAVQLFVQQVARGEGPASSSSNSGSSNSSGSNGHAATPAASHRPSASPLASPSSSTSSSSSSSNIIAADSRYSPAVRELMAKAATAKAALPAGAAISLVPQAAQAAPSHPAISPPSSSSSNGSSGLSSNSSGLYSAGTAVARNVSALAVASPSASSGSVFALHRGGGGSGDIEAQADDLKGHKTPRSRFGALRAAATKGGWVRRTFCQWRPQKIVLAVMVAALLLSLLLYIRLAASMIQESSPTALTPTNAPLPLASVVDTPMPSMQLLDPPQ